MLAVVILIVTLFIIPATVFLAQRDGYRRIPVTDDAWSNRMRSIR